MHHSQCQEDKYLNQHFFKNKRNGIYIELGALDGKLYSNTKFFQDELDWRGILIEPHPNKFKDMEKNRPNNFLFNNLVSNSEEELKFKYFVNGHAAVSGVENTLPQSHFDIYFDNEREKSLPQDSIYIKPKTLTEIIKQTKISHIDFLSLDVEGHEYEVLQSWDFSVPIDLVMIEMLKDQTEKNEACRQLLLSHDYGFHSRYKHNEIFIQHGIFFK
jgi:FkbM family methyltransferase